MKRASTRQRTPTRRRRRRFFYQIHFRRRGEYVVSGSLLASGMLEAERMVEDRQRDVAGKMQETFRGFVIVNNRKLLP